MKRSFNSPVVLTFACAALVLGVLTKTDVEDGWILLHDGQSSAGWSPASGSGWATKDGALSMDGTAILGYLRTMEPYADFLLRFEVKTSGPNSNAGLFVRTNKEGNPKETGYKIQLGAGDSEWPFGSIVGQTKGTGSFANNSWIAMEVEVNGSSLIVRSNSHVVSSASIQGQAGLIELEANHGGRVEIRNLRLKPLNPQALFNGTDLSGWKSTGFLPKPGSGVFKMFSGKPKPKEVKWTVNNGLIHGDGGPGQLESMTPYGDFLFQAAVRINAKKNENKRPYLLLIRGDAGQLGSGYEVNLAPGAMGAFSAGGSKTSAGTVNEFSVVTVGAFNREFQVWVDGVPVTAFSDVRPEGTNPKKDARVTAGIIAFDCPEDNSNLDIRNVKIVQLPKILGHTPAKKQTHEETKNQAPAAQPPPVVAAAPQPAAQGNDAQTKLLQEQLQQQKMEQKKQEDDKQKISALEQKALNSKDPQEQVGLFDQILLIDPNNQVAFNGRKDAQIKVDAENNRKNAEAQKSAQEQADVAQKQQSFSANLDKAEAAFVSGNLKSADQALSAAEKANPADPRVKDLRQRLDAARGRMTSIVGLAALGGAAILLGGLAVLFKAGRKKDPYLEIVEGLDKGKKYNIEQEVIHLGAIAEDGGAKNEIVLRDAERMVSRFHAEMHFKDGKIYVIDNGSRNGTFVDKKRIPAGKPQQLKNGAHVSFGGTCTIKIGFEKRAKAKKA